MSEIKKTLLLLLLACLTLTINAQEVSYGPVVGSNLYDIETNGQITGGNGIALYNLGAFINFKLNEKFDLKSNLLYSSYREGAYGTKDNDVPSLEFNNTKLRTFQIQLLAKYHIKNSDGIYIVAGPGSTFLIEAIDADTDTDIKDFYKNTYINFLLGFSFRLSKLLDLELLADRNITNVIDSASSKSKNYGLFLNLTINLAPLFIK